MYFWRLNPDSRLRDLERQAIYDPDARIKLAIEYARAGTLPTVYLRPGSPALVEAHGFDPWASLTIFPKSIPQFRSVDGKLAAKEELFAHFGIYTHATVGKPFPPAYIEKTNRLREMYPDSASSNDWLTPTILAKVGYYYSDLMQLADGGGLVMTLLVDDQLIDLIVADLSSVITGGEIYWVNNPNPAARNFIMHVYETGEQEFLVFDISPINPELWIPYNAIR